jgi:hypothetical protein
VTATRSEIIFAILLGDFNIADLICFRSGKLPAAVEFVEAAKTERQNSPPAWASRPASSRCAPGVESERRLESCGETIET